ncbi:short-chain dehydrogenase/reductase [Hypoxylon trugodes]|uniref:short-chain dehydrogenase/reductase n=1 Tax=Hypoxylon trugodes TaxID=326681 RepID=UPI002195739F|nr:short-chain dehydrogenase/reductase [Hypoxylon trugodes]KAI1392106.1 short-chain dehydrogenase/reductase [Hypoxylon trugodes]
MPSLIQQFWDARNPPADPTHLSFEGKTVLVTGANSGMGFHAAIKYAQLGASKLILVARSKEKGEAAKASIIDKTKTKADITVMAVDLERFASVKEFSRQVYEQVDDLHVALLCAGVMIPEFALGPEGYEINLQVNVLSTALMALLLLPKIRDTGRRSGSQDPAHLCILNSMATQEFDEKWIEPGESLIDRIGDSSKFDHVSQYYLVKLAARYFIQGISNSSKDDETVVINCCCPALSWTNLHRHYGLFTNIMLYPYKLLCARTAEQGARTLVSATGLGRESHGKLWLNDELPPPAMFFATERSNELYRQTCGEIMSILKEKADFN